MAVLSKKSQLILIQETNKPLATAILAAVAGRTALSAKNQVQLASYMASTLKSKAKAKSSVDEVVAAIVSGAALSLGAKRRLLELMADAKAGNELVNVIQTVATASIKL